MFCGESKGHQISSIESLDVNKNASYWLDINQCNPCLARSHHLVAAFSRTEIIILGGLRLGEVQGDAYILNTCGMYLEKVMD